MYWIYEDAIIFYQEFNNKLDVKLLCNYKKIIFSNYKFNVLEYKSYIENYKKNYLSYWEPNLNRYIKNYFNRQVNCLPLSITHLTQRS